jgi:hypothetical protein
MTRRLQHIRGQLGLRARLQRLERVLERCLHTASVGAG